MPSYNRVIMVGRLTKDPELKYTSAGLAVATFTIAVDRRFKNAQGERATDFFRCKAWRNKAEFISNYATKGRLVVIDGSIETSEVVGQDGTKRYFTDIVCENIETLDAAPQGETPYHPPSTPMRPKAQARPATPNVPQHGQGADPIDDDPFADQ